MMIGKICQIYCWNIHILTTFFTVIFFSRSFKGSLVEQYEKNKGFGSHPGGVLQVFSSALSCNIMHGMRPEIWGINFKYLNSITCIIIRQHTKIRYTSIFILTRFCFKKMKERLSNIVYAGKSCSLLFCMSISLSIVQDGYVTSVKGYYIDFVYAMYI